MKPSIYRSKSVQFYSLFCFLEDFGLIYAVYMILFRRQGLSYVQISLLLAAWSGTMLILEVPSGILADLWSRKAVVALSMAPKAAAFLIWAFKPDFTGFLIGFIAWGVEEAFCSGTTDALLYDALRQEKLEASYEAAIGAGEIASKAGTVTAMIVGGLLFDRYPRTTLMLSAVPMLLAGVCVLFIAESRDSFRSRRAESSAVRPAAPGAASLGAVSPGAASLLRLRQAVQEAARGPGLAAFVLMGSLIGASYGAMEEFDSLYGRQVGVPVGFIGFWVAFRFAVEGFGAALAPALRRRLRLHRPGRFTLWILAAGLLLLLGTLAPGPLLAPLYFAYYGMIVAALIVYEGGLQRRIESTGRATLSSLASFLTTGAGMSLGVLFGFIAQGRGLASLFRLGALLTIITAALYAFYAARHDRTGPRLRKR